ncbi:hypothetical protein APP_04170 [Aeribacillus pallidus]|nr:hypothetical protein APP_04170 [Aeribacillus pallidus]
MIHSVDKCKFFYFIRHNRVKAIRLFYFQAAGRTNWQKGFKPAVTIGQFANKEALPSTPLDQKST